MFMGNIVRNDNALRIGRRTNAWSAGNFMIDCVQLIPAQPYKRNKTDWNWKVRTKTKHALIMYGKKTTGSGRSNGQKNVGRTPKS